MKRITVMLLCILLLIGCASRAVRGTEETMLTITDVESEPESGDEMGNTLPTIAPEPMTEPLLFDYYAAVRDLAYPEWPTEGEMFRGDVSGSGIEETVSYRLLEDEWATEITVGEDTIRLEEGSDLARVLLLDLDPVNARRNLLVVIDQASADYVTVEVHYEDDELVIGTVVYADMEWQDGALQGYERADILGTRSGVRRYAGEDLHPESDWLDTVYVPTANEIAEELTDLIDTGLILQTVRDLPCEIDDKAAMLPAGTLLYPLRWTADESTVEVRTTDGTTAVISVVVGDWEYRIDGVPQAQYFTNLEYAD